MAKVILTGAFVLITDDHRRFEFAAGKQDIPDELSDHWYVKAHCEQGYHAPVKAEVEPAVVETPIESAEVAKRQPGRTKKS